MTLQLEQRLLTVEEYHKMVDAGILTEDDRVELLCKVKDTGIGIPNDRLARLFKSFSQADASTSRKYGSALCGPVKSTGNCIF